MQDWIHTICREYPNVADASLTSTGSGDCRRLRAEHHDDFRMLLVDSLKESFRMSTEL